METFDGTAGEARAAGRRIRNDIDDGAEGIKSAASAEIKSLIADVEDLVSRIADLKDADVARGAQQGAACRRNRQGESRRQRRNVAPPGAACRQHRR